jgi:hypothetical protein
MKESIQKVTKQGYPIVENLRSYQLQLERTSTTTPIRILNTILCSATPFDMKMLRENVELSVKVVDRIVKNAGLFSTYLIKLQYLRYEEPNLLFLLDNIEKTRDLIEEVIYNGNNKLYQTEQTIKTSNTLINTVSKMKTLDILQKMPQQIVTRFFDKDNLVDKIENSKENRGKINKLIISVETMNTPLEKARKDLPQFKDSVNELCIRLEPLRSQLNRLLGVSV